SWVSVWEPTGYAVDVFRKSLEEQGIEVSEKAHEDIGSAPDEATVLTSKQSIPLSELLIPYMKLSNNGHAETLTKEMGKVAGDEGSWDEGLEIMEETLASFGMDTGTLQLRDGSGMSHKDMVTSDELTHLLYQIQDKSWFSDYETSLPVAGIDERFVGGSLRYRMTDPPTKGNVVAKTGSISGVSTLSGYVTSADDEDLIFSIMINSFLERHVTKIEANIATILAKHEFERNQKRTTDKQERLYQAFLLYYKLILIRLGCLQRCFLYLSVPQLHCRFKKNLNSRKQCIFTNVETLVMMTVSQFCSKHTIRRNPAVILYFFHKVGGIFRTGNIIIFKHTFLDIRDIPGTFLHNAIQRVGTIAIDAFSDKFYFRFQFIHRGRTSCNSFYTLLDVGINV